MEKRESEDRDRFTWKKGDVEIYDSVADFERAMKEEGADVIRPRKERKPRPKST